MRRNASTYLENWLHDPNRRPLVVRGARQVGKTWLIRDLAGRAGRDLVELNFERDPRLARHFADHDPRRVLENLALTLDRDISPERSLLFLDEVQAAGEVLASLRWFAEELPALPVVAAGSLLELRLGQGGHGMPVGRVSYCHVGPLSFPEYLRAHDQHRLLEHLGAWLPGQALALAAHEQANVWFERYVMVGGMPRVVTADVDANDARATRRLQHDLAASFRDDFTKYAGRADPSLLDAVLLAIAANLGRKFVYAHIGEGVKQHQAKRMLALLAEARVCHLVRHTHANGLPLGGEVKETFRKAILLDVGLAHALLATPAGPRFPKLGELSPAVRGQLMEQIAGQQLAALDDDACSEPALYYWQREGGRPGEIDFVCSLQQRIVPIEIKSGATGAMKSLHQFMFDKNLTAAVRLVASPPVVQTMAVKTTQGQDVTYRLASLPHYLAWRLPQVMASLSG